MKKIVLTVVCAVLIIAAFWGGITVGTKMNGNKKGGEEKKVVRKVPAKKDEPEKSGIKGARITFKIDKDSPTEAETEIAETVFKSRLAENGYPGAEVKAVKGMITADIPMAEYNESRINALTELLCSNAKLEFLDADGNVVLDGATDIRDAAYEYGSTSSGGNETHHIKIRLKTEAITKFADATRAIAERASEGKNYVSIRVDGEEVSKPKVRSELKTEVLVIEGIDFTEESAKMLASQIKSGQLPFGVTPVSREKIGEDDDAGTIEW